MKTPAVLRVTEREIEVWRSLSGGLTIKEAAAKLGLHIKTIEYSRDRLYRKLGCNNAAQAVLLAVTYGIITVAREGAYEIIPKNPKAYSHYVRRAKELA